MSTPKAVSFKFNELLDIESTKKKDVIEFNEIKNKTPWIDKYRPTKLKDVLHQEDVIKMLSKTLETGNLPHLLFYGPPGTGKTSTILAMAFELFGPRRARDRIIELNASDERGINVVRDKIITFAKSAIGTADPRYPSPPYKIIILDEADAMTTEAQSALRKTMEDNSSITRFCFICNYYNQIIDPIISRCVKFRFKPISNDSVVSRLKYIATEEKMNVTDTALYEISKISEGDMRKAILVLQNTKYSKQLVTTGLVHHLAGIVPSNVIEEIVDTCITQSMNDVVQITKKIRNTGYPFNNIVKQTVEYVINEERLTDSMKGEICFRFGTIEKRLIDGANEYLQLLSGLTCIYDVSHRKN